MDSEALIQFNPRTVGRPVPHDILKELADRASEVKSIKTPASQIQEKGDFPYAKWSYMLEQMDKLHPMRAEIITHEELLTGGQNGMPWVWNVSVRVTDLLTGEARSGSDCHPIVIYEERSDVLKPPKSIRELIGNAKKGCLTKALRNAYSNFGICADLYQSKPDDPPTELQQSKMQELDSQMKTMQVSSHAEWWAGVMGKWKEMTADTADAYFNKVAPVVDKLREKHLTNNSPQP